MKTEDNISTIARRCSVHFASLICQSLRLVLRFVALSPSVTLPHFHSALKDALMGGSVETSFANY